VTAGATHVPKPLVAQLKPGGRMLIPLGANDDNQRLTLVTKDADGKVAVRRLGRVVFIPLDERARPRS
jgi:protein-L-isoaspartate(D-aspartate) O-methyltransferase